MSHNKETMQGNADDSNDLQINNWRKLEFNIFILLNEVNAVNIGTVRKRLLKLNILRGRGVFCRYIMQGQLYSTHYTHVYASLVASINLEFPSVGELLLKRCIMAFKIGHDQEEKPQCLASAIFIAHLVNHSVAADTVAIECMQYLIESPTLDSIEIALEIMYGCGKKLSESYPLPINIVYNAMETFLSDYPLNGQVYNLLKRVYSAQTLGFKPCRLDLVPDEYQNTHRLSLDDTWDFENEVKDYYQFDPSYEANETSYKLSAKKFLESDSEDEAKHDQTKKH